ncbi:hypothetical protein AHAS_Ahas16G0193100 [Arachis hypogaea]
MSSFRRHSIARASSATAHSHDLLSLLHALHELPLLPLSFCLSLSLAIHPRHPQIVSPDLKPTSKKFEVNEFVNPKDNNKPIQKGTKQSIRDRIGNNVDVYGYGNKRCVCCFFPAVHPAPVQPPPDLLSLDDPVPAAAELEVKNALPLAIVPVADQTTSAVPNQTNGTTGWKLVSNESATATSKLRGDITSMQPGLDAIKFSEQCIYSCIFIVEEKPHVEEKPSEKPSEGSINRAMLIFINAVLARVATEKRVSLVKAWEESERSKAENKICGKEEKTVDMQYYSVYEQEQCGSRHTYNTCLQPAQ